MSILPKSINLLKNIVFLTCLLILSSCSSKTVSIEEIHKENDLILYDQAYTIWNKYIEKNLVQSPFLVDGSMRFATNDDSVRMNFLLWSNDNFPLRIDINAGFTNYANILIDEDNYGEKISIFIKPRKTLMISNNKKDESIDILNFSFPFNFENMIKILNNNSIIQKNTLYSNVYKSNDGDYFIYKVNAKEEYITLDSNSMLVNWKNVDWNIDLTYNQETLSKIVATGDNDVFTMFINSIIYKNESFLEETLKLNYPSDTNLIFLKR